MEAGEVSGWACLRGAVSVQPLQVQALGKTMWGPKCLSQASCTAMQVARAAALRHAWQKAQESEPCLLAHLSLAWGIGLLRAWHGPLCAPASSSQHSTVQHSAAQRGAAQRWVVYAAAHRQGKGVAGPASQATQQTHAGKSAGIGKPCHCLIGHQASGPI